VRTAPRLALAVLVVAAVVAVAIGVASWGMGAVADGSQSSSSQSSSSQSSSSQSFGTEAVAPHGPGWTAWGVRPDGTPLRWDPCRPIEWVVRSSDPPWLVDVATTALSQVGDEAGVTFRHVGIDDGPIGADRGTADDDRWQPVVVTLASRDRDSWLAEDDRALAVPVVVDDVFVTGQVLLADDVVLAPDFSSRDRSWGATLLHEGAHLVGLDHVDDPDQLLYPYPVPGPAVFGSGDHDGLAALRADGSCLDPGPVRDLHLPTPQRPGSSPMSTPP